MKGPLKIIREAKATPKKTGQFVSIWKRKEEAITAPHHINDEFETLIIECKDENKSGRFIFPKSILAEKGIVSTPERKGKRGIRVYPPWDKPKSKQGLKTQAWQIKFFESD